MPPARSQLARRHGAPLLALLGLVVACGPGDGDGRSGGSSASDEERRTRPRHLVLVSIDTLRADRLGCYGYERPTSPTLDAIAAGGALFEDASAPSPWTLPSHAALFTGLYPRRNGVITTRHELPEGVQHVATILSREGFETAAFVSNSLLTTNGMQRGFETLEEVDKGGPHPSAVSERTAAWLRARDDPRPLFLLVHYIDPHSDYGALPQFAEPFLEPYDGPATGTSEQLFEFVRGALPLSAADARHLSNLYDAGIRQLDEEIRELHEALAETGVLADALLVVTSDHGEEFLEHGGLMHGQTQFEELVRVPLLMSGPGLPVGVRVEDPVSLVDVLPTVLDHLGVPAPEGLDGVSLRGTWYGAPLTPRTLYFEADLDPPSAERPMLSKGHDRAIRDGSFKLHLDKRTGEVRLHDLAVDPLEQHDVAAEHPERVRAMRAELERFLASRRAARERELTDEDLERLRELGYAGGGSEDE